MWLVLVALWTQWAMPLDARVSALGLDAGWQGRAWRSERPPELERHALDWYTDPAEDFTLAGHHPTAVRYGYKPGVGLAGVLVIFDEADCPEVGAALYDALGWWHAEEGIGGGPHVEYVLTTWDAAAVNIRWMPHMAGECFISYRIPR